jgi:hypothetical protein
MTGLSADLSAAWLERARVAFNLEMDRPVSLLHAGIRVKDRIHVFAPAKIKQASCRAASDRCR